MTRMTQLWCGGHWLFPTVRTRVFGVIFELEQENKHSRKNEVYTRGGARSANEEELSVNGQLGPARTQWSNRMGTGLRETEAVEGVLSNVDHTQAMQGASSRDGLTGERDTL
jgi:hypothetical protein